MEWDYAPGDPRRDESDEAEAKRRAPLPPPPSQVEIFLEQWYKDHPECPRIDLPPCSIWDPEGYKKWEDKTRWDMGVEEEKG